MKMKVMFYFVWFSATLVCISATPAVAQQLITNGGFESGFTGWTRTDQIGSEGTWAQQSGTSSPVNAFAVPAPPGGATAAMTDAQGPGSHILYQDFTVPPTLGMATLQFDLYINNHAIDFFSPTSLDFSTPALNQQVRVDILTTSADPFSVSPADILMNIYRTQSGNPLVAGYTTIVSDLTAFFSAHPGETLRLRFAEVDNVNFLNAGIDNVSITVPEPASLSLVLGSLGLVGLLFVRHQRRQ